MDVLNNLVDLLLAPAILVAVVYFFGYIIMGTALRKYKKSIYLENKPMILFIGTIFLLMISGFFMRFIPSLVVGNPTHLTELVDLLLLMCPILIVCMIVYVLEIARKVSWLRICICDILLSLLGYVSLLCLYLPPLESHWNKLVDNELGLSNIVDTFMALSDLIFFIFFLVYYLLGFSYIFGLILAKLKTFSPSKNIEIHLNEEGKSILGKTPINHLLIEDNKGEYRLYDEKTNSNIVINKSYVIQAIVKDQKKEKPNQKKEPKQKTNKQEKEK